MKYSIGHLPAARQDIADILEWLRRDAPHVEARFQTVYRATIANILEHPLMYAETEHGMRKVLLRPFSIQVGYFVDNDIVVVMGVIHTSRDPRTWSVRLDASDE